MNQHEIVGILTQKSNQVKSLTSQKERVRDQYRQRVSGIRIYNIVIISTHFMLAPDFLLCFSMFKFTYFFSLLLLFVGQMAGSV